MPPAGPRKSAEAALANAGTTPARQVFTVCVSELSGMSTAPSVSTIL